MSRVLHVIGSLDRGGAESVLLDLIRADQSVEHAVLCWSGREGLLAEEFKSAGATVYVAQGGSEFSRLLGARRLMRRLVPIAVVSHLSLASAFILAMAPSGTYRRVARMHSAGDGKHGSPARRLYRAAARALLPFTATHVLAVSGAALDFAIGRAGTLHGLLRTQRLRLPNGVDTSRFVPREPSRGATPLVVHVGRSAPEKNRAVLVPIFMALQQRTHARMQVVGTTSTSGSGPLPDSSDFSISGQRSDIEHVIASADVLLLPSTREGLPGVVLEALSCAVPVVVSDLPTLRELDRDLAGITYVDVEAAPEVWAAAIEVATALPWQDRLGLRERLAASRYTLERNISEWGALWRS